MPNEEMIFGELEAELLTALVERECTNKTVTEYRYICNSIFREMKNTGELNYTKEGSIKYLDSYLESNGENPYYRNLRTVISRLNDIVDGDWHEQHYYKKKCIEISDLQKRIIDEYCQTCEDAGKAKGTIKLKRHDTEWFFFMLKEAGCNTIEEISVPFISKHA